MESVSLAIILLIIALLVSGILHGIALYHDFFITPKNHAIVIFPKQIFFVLIILFLVLSKFLPIIIFTVFEKSLLFLRDISSIPTLKMLSYSLSSILTICLILTVGYCQNKTTLVKVIGYKKEALFYYIKNAIITFFLATSTILAIGILLQLLIFWMFGQSGNEQSIITYLRENKESFGVRFFGFLNIVLFAPTLEEIIFRGLIQNFFSSIMKVKSAILITSLLFSLVHFSSDQGVGNFALLSCIFVLSCYLGFVYEKTSSLISPILVHMLFNLDGIVRIFI